MTYGIILRTYVGIVRQRNTRGLPCKGKIQSLSNLIGFKDLKKHVHNYLNFQQSLRLKDL